MTDATQIPAGYILHLFRRMRADLQRYVDEVNDDGHLVLAASLFPCFFAWGVVDELHPRIAPNDQALRDAITKVVGVGLAAACPTYPDATPPPIH